MNRMVLVFASTFVVCIASAFATRAEDYVVIEHKATVTAPADAVWQKIGDFCAVPRAAKMSCQMVSGAGDVGSVRRVTGSPTEQPEASPTELLEARTAHSYTYEGGLRAYDVHGTLAVEPIDAGHARVIYTVVYDRARVTDRNREQFHDQFSGLVQQLVVHIQTMFD